MKNKKLVTALTILTLLTKITKASYNDIKTLEASEKMPLFLSESQDFKDNNPFSALKKEEFETLGEVILPLLKCQDDSFQKNWDAVGEKAARYLEAYRTAEHSHLLKQPGDKWDTKKAESIARQEEPLGPILRAFTEDIASASRGRFPGERIHTTIEILFGESSAIFRTSKAIYNLLKIKKHQKYSDYKVTEMNPWPDEHSLWFQMYSKEKERRLALEK